MKPKIVYLIFVLFGILCASECTEYFHENLCTSPTDCDHTEVSQTIEFLKNGEKHFKLDDKYRNLTLLIGSTGTGKSTLTRYIAAKLADLKSVKKGRSIFVIEYNEPGVIGNSTTVSQTIYPELVIDDEQNAFYDCPGFDDSRNASFQIAATYFIKKVVEHAHNLKFVLVVNYNDVTRGQSRDDMPTLVKHLSEFIRNITIYRDSISLVATKAANETDENLIGNVADFLQEYRGEQLKHQANNTLARYAVELLDILLTNRTTNNVTTFDKIGVFKKPIKSGPLNTMQEMVIGKQNLREMILNRTQYSKKIDNNFNYTISVESIVKLVDITVGINNGIKGLLQNIGNETITSFDGEINKLENLIALTHRLESGNSRLLAITENTKNLTPELLVERIRNATNDLRISISNEYLNDILIRTNYIRFLQNFTTKHLAVNTVAWLNGLGPCIEYLENNKNWYKFLSDIYTKFSEYDFRRNLTKYNVFDLNDWGTDGKKQGIYIFPETFAAFVNKSEVPSLTPNFKPTQFQLDTLNDLLNITLKQQPTVSCEADDTKLVIKGDYVRTSDLNLTQYKQLKELHLFALHTVFIDSDIKIMDKIIDVVIIARNWNIWGDRKIILSGAVAENVTSARANVGGVQSKKATAGIPGLPGGTTGNFIALGANFINGKKLTVNIIGGAGSRGQDGGLGFNGTEADVKNLKSDTDTGEAELRDGNYRKFEDAKDPPLGCDSSYYPDTGQRVKVCTGSWYIYQECNGYGGDGGQGGFGGLPGHVQFFELNGASWINFILQNGSMGQNGTGGPTNSTDPTKIKLRHKTVTSIMGGSKTNGDWTYVSHDKDDSCPKNQSIDGGNAVDITQPQKPSYFDPSFVINEFGAFVRENQANRLKRHDLAHLIELIANNTNVLRNYTTKGFVNDFQLLEDQFYRLQNDVNLTYYYRSLSNRIENYVGILNASNIPLPHEQLIVFNYLYTTALGKYLTLGSKESNMIINIETYLTLTNNAIKEFQDAKRATVIEGKRQLYRKEIDAKIKEAKTFIDSEISPAITKISGSFDKNLEAVVNETIAKRKNAEKQRDEYIKQQEQLQKQASLHLIFGSLKLIGTAASFMGPYGMAANAVINGASQIADGFIADPEKKEVPGIPEGVKEAFDGLTEAYKKKNEETLKELDEQLENMKKLIIKNPDKLKELEQDIGDIEKRLKAELVKEAPSLEETTKISGEMETAIAKQKTKIPKDQTEVLKNLKNFENAIKLTQTAFDVYKQIKGDQDKIDELNQAMDKNQDNINKLRKYQTEIYAKLWPMIDQMRGNLNNMKRGLVGKSGAILAIKQWNIQSMLRDTKYELARLTKDFDAQDDLLQTFQKLNDAFVTLITVYDRIDSYTDQEKLGDYIAAVASTAVNVKDVSDPELQSAINQLNLIITANVLLTQYKLATDAFKQNVFPFITSYLKEYQLPSSLKLGDSTTDLVTAATTKLTALSLKIVEYNGAVINGNRKYIISATFDPRSESSSAFFEWNYDNYGEAIDNLLNGKRVSFHADIKRAPQVNAIKFNMVELLLLAPGHQAKIDKILQKFDIILTHMGTSYYRCGADFYSIESPSQEISYSFEKNTDGSRYRKNDVYDLLMAGNLMLSPYTMWTIQLEIAKNDTTFAELSQAVDRVNLVLIGHGKYVRNDVPVCGNSLEDYYQIVK